MKIKFELKAIAFALLVFTTACNSKQADNKANKSIRTYPSATIELQDAHLYTTYPVTLRGEKDIEIKPRIDGFIDAVYVDEGSKVTKGQPLFKINSPTADQNLERAQAAYNTAKLDMERMRPLADKGIISAVRIEGYQNVLSGAKAALEQAKAMQSWTVVRSPINGNVGVIPYREGSLVNNMNILTTVSNTQNVVANFAMNEKELAEYLRNTKGNTDTEKIKNMPPVTLVLADGSEYPEKGKIETISGKVDDVSGAVRFRASFPNKNTELRSGGSGKIRLPYIIENVPVIPQKVTFKQQDKVMVYKLNTDTTAQTAIEVKPMPDGQHYAVINGLKKGDKIVTDGIATLQNGVKIQLKNND